MKNKIWWVDNGMLQLQHYDDEHRAPGYMTPENGYFPTPEQAIEFSRARRHASVDFDHDYMRALHGVDR